jgi:hypothetical protein
MRINLEIRNVDYNKTILAWTVELDFKENLYNFLYLVEISESENGPWIPLFLDPIYAFGFVDTMTQRGMIDQRLYYRVKAIDSQGNEFFSDNKSIIEEDDNYIANYVARQQQLLLERYNGQEFLHYARKKFGPRCSNCYLETERKTFMSKCPVCFGTTYEGGYFAPVKISLNKDPQLKGIDKDAHGVNEAKNAVFLTSNEVIIEADDLLVALKKTDQRYFVTQIVPVSLHDRTTSQRVITEQVKSDNPAQLVPVDLNAYTLEEFNVFRRDWKIIR